MSMNVQILERSLHHKEDLAVLLQHKGVNGAGCFVNDVPGARDPIVLQIPPGTTKGQGKHRAVMSVNTEIATCGSAQSDHPAARRRVGLDELHITSTLPIWEPRRVVRGNIECV